MLEIIIIIIKKFNQIAKSLTGIRSGKMNSRIPEIVEELQSFDFYPFRRRWGSGFRPHFSFKYRSVVWHVDSSRGTAGEVNLITHAHTDHYGQRNAKNPFALASEETATILEVCCGGFSGRIFRVGETVRIRKNETKVKVKTYPTHHMHGSAAFMLGDVLITGDVKDYRDLPKCRVLVTEATYGSPEFVFEDEIDKLLSVDRAALGAYPIGKSQKVAQILIDAGKNVSVEGKAEAICRRLGIDVCDSGEVVITSPRELKNKAGRKYVLTAQKFYSFPRIVVSDHVDYRGILEMVEHCDPEYVLFYHGRASEMLVQEVKEMGCEVLTLEDLNFLSC